MVDHYSAPHGTYVGTLATDVATLKALLGGEGGSSAGSPDFNKIQPEVRDKICVELDALLAAN